MLSERAQVLYKATDYYAPQHERTLAWNDPDLKIDWELEGDPIVSRKISVAKHCAKPRPSNSPGNWMRVTIFGASGLLGKELMRHWLEDE